MWLLLCPRGVFLFVFCWAAVSFFCESAIYTTCNYSLNFCADCNMQRGRIVSIWHVTSANCCLNIPHSQFYCRVICLDGPPNEQKCCFFDRFCVNTNFMLSSWEVDLVNGLGISALHVEQGWCALWHVTYLLALTLYVHNYSVTILACSLTRSLSLSLSPSMQMALTWAKAVWFREWLKAPLLLVIPTTPSLQS